MKRNEIDPFYKVKNDRSNLIPTDDLLQRPPGNQEGLKRLWPENLSLPYRVVLLQSTTELPQAKLFHQLIFHMAFPSVTASFLGPDTIPLSCGISRTHFRHWNMEKGMVDILPQFVFWCFLLLLLSLLRRHTRC